MAEKAAVGLNKIDNRPMKKQEFYRYFASLLNGLSKNNQTGTKLLRNAIVPVLVLAGWEQSAEAGLVNFTYTGNLEDF